MGFHQTLKNPLKAGQSERSWPWETRILAGRMPVGTAVRQSIGLGLSTRGFQ
jgi:hypothetical protein